MKVFKTNDKFCNWEYPASEKHGYVPDAQPRRSTVVSGKDHGDVVLKVVGINLKILILNS